MKALFEIVTENNPTQERWVSEPFRIREDGQYEYLRWDPVTGRYVPTGRLHNPNEKGR
jgi:hypothetical protein